MAHSGPSADEATTLQDVLGLVLQHSDLLQRRTPAPCWRDTRHWPRHDFCRLLETSKAVAAAVQAVPGRLDMEINIRTTQQVDATVPWLVRHGQSIGLFEINTAFFGCVDDDDDDDDEEEEEEEEEDPAVRDQRLAAAVEGRAAAEVALVAALQQAAAAAAAPGLQLRRLDIEMPPSTAVQLLQLAHRQLTHLQLCGCFHESEAGVASLAAEIAALPRLEQLELLAQGTEQVLAGLSGSRSLRHLKGNLFCSLLAGLPSQLQELTLSAMRERDGCALQLRHCTALTRLEVSSVSLEAQDELPDSLVKLDVMCCSSCEPLVGLTRLRELSIQHKPPPAAELRRLSQLSSLSRIQLGYRGVESMLASAEAWAVLPGLLELDLKMWGPVDSACVPVMRHLAKATRVNKLSVLDLAVDEVAMVSQALAAALPGLTQLHDLKFDVGHWNGANWGEPSPVLEAGVTALAAAIAGLPSLQDLGLSGLPWDLFVPPFAAVGTQLTSLELYGGTDVLDVDFSRMFCGLTQLRSLVLGHEWATDDVLVVTADHLQQLSRLAVYLSPALRLSVKGLQQLARMERLRRFEVNRFFGSSEHNFRAADVRAALVAAGGDDDSLQVVIEGPK